MAGEEYKTARRRQVWLAVATGVVAGMMLSNMVHALASDQGWAMWFAFTAIFSSQAVVAVLRVK